MSKKGYLDPQLYYAMAAATHVDLTTISKVALLIEQRKIEIDSIVTTCEKANIQLDQEAVIEKLTYYNNELYKLLITSKPEEDLTDGDKYAPIQDALYATGNFTTEQCDNMTEGILQYIDDAELELTRKAIV